VVAGKLGRKHSLGPDSACLPTGSEKEGVGPQGLKGTKEQVCYVRGGRNKTGGEEVLQTDGHQRLRRVLLKEGRGKKGKFFWIERKKKNRKGG